MQSSHGDSSLDKHATIDTELFNGDLTNSFDNENCSLSEIVLKELFVFGEESSTSSKEPTNMDTGSDTTSMAKWSHPDNSLNDSQEAESFSMWIRSKAIKPNGKRPETKSQQLLCSSMT